MPKGFTPHQKELIRQRLMQQGHKLFSAQGLKKTTVEELALSVGISKAAFYIFFDSKEVLFMDVVEQAETDFRRQVLSAVDLPGPSPRARLLAIFKKAFNHWKTVPILQAITRRDFDMLATKVPLEKIQEHLNSDQVFIHELVDCCQKAGIPIQAQPEQIDGLMHALFFTILHENDLGPDGISGPIDILLELVSAYCLGEVNTTMSQEGAQK